MITPSKKKRLPAGTKKSSVGLDKAALTAAVAEVRERLAGHGGGLDLVKVGRDSVTVRLTGGCVGCPMARLTLKNGVERLLKARVKGLKRVSAV